MCKSSKRKKESQKEFGFIDFADGTCFKHLQLVYNNELKDYKSNIEVNNLIKTKINDYTIITYDLLWDSQKEIGYNMYQKIAVYATSDYIYTITQNSDKEIDSKEFTNLLNTFKPAKVASESIIPEVIVILIICTLIIIYFKRSKKK